MDIDEITEFVRNLDGTLIVVAEHGSAFPETAWGDAFFYYSPDGVIPERMQPYGSITTKHTPGDSESRLGTPGRFRVNIHLDRERAAQLASPDGDPATPDVVLPHPLYGTAGWVCVISPAARTAALVCELLQKAHENARARAERRRGGY